MKDELPRTQRKYEPFQTLEVGDAANDLDGVVACVIDRCGRIELSRNGTAEAVIISKAELHGLEAALEILAREPGGLRLRREVARLVMGSRVATGESPQPWLPEGGCPDAGLAGTGA